MKKIIIWGAGKKGIGVSTKLRKENILYFCDCNPNKIGKYINGYKIENAEKILYEDPYEAVVVTTIPLSDKIVAAISRKWTGKVYSLEEFFSIPDIKNQMDEDLLASYYIDFRIRDNLFGITRGNWFRNQEFSHKNCELIQAMQKSDTDTMNNIMNEAYDSGKKFFDEYYDERPGMRLIYNIITNEVHTSIKIADFACGHGELIQKLADHGYDAYALDFSSDRLKELNNVKITVGDVAKTPFKDNFYDISICMECMEHVDNVVRLANELVRVTKVGGLIFITVPYLKHCDDEMHVRQFDEVSLWGLFCEECQLENILIIPYLNYTSDDNLLIVLKKL